MNLSTTTHRKPEAQMEMGMGMEQSLTPRLPGRWWLKRQQGEPLGEFLLRLLDEWAKERASLGQESPVLGVRALGGRPALEIVLRNGSRWLVPRGQDDGKVSARKGVYPYGGERR